MTSGLQGLAGLAGLGIGGELTPLQLYFQTAGITDSTAIAAVTALYNGFVSNGTLPKKLAIYPMSGPSVAACSYNLANLAQYRLTYASGGDAPSYVARGLQLANSGAASTNMPMSALDSNSLSFSTYFSAASGPFYDGGNGWGGIEDGAENTEGLVLFSQVWGQYHEIRSTTNDSNAWTLMSGDVNSALGHRLINRGTNQSLTGIWTQGTKTLDSNRFRSVEPFSTSKILQIGRCAAVGAATPTPIAYADIGLGYTAEEIAADFAVIQAYQDAMGRAV